jgi:glycosyltransferase involved in cell wall biosynthesis
MARFERAILRVLALCIHAGPADPVKEMSKDRGQESMGKKSSPPSFIILTYSDFWDDPPRARHQVAEALAKGYKVSFISANRRGRPRLDRCRVQENLEVFTPFFPIDSRIRYRIPAINYRYQAWLFPLLKREIADDKVIVINWDYTATRVFEYYDKVVFYCNDYPIRYYYFNAIKKYLEKCEQTMAEKSLLCVATVNFLVERLRKFNENVIELRLGAPLIDGELKFTRNDTVRIGLVGFLDARRISLSIIKGLVSRPNVELHVYGVLHPRLRKDLERYGNIRLRGILTGKLLIEDLKRIDVGIAPYRVSDVNPGGTPNKLWLYLAVGKPVVISDLPSIKDWQFHDDFVYKAKDDKDFVEKIFSAYNRDSEELMKLRADFARENSWDTRITVLLERINAAIGQGDGFPGLPRDISVRL